MSTIRPVHYRKLAKVFEYKGFRYIRTRGDHLIYIKQGILRPIVIPRYKEIPEFVILRNLKTAGITRNEYLELIKKV